MNAGATNKQPDGPPAAAAADRTCSSWLHGKGLFWIPILPLVALDLWSKAAVFAWLRGLHPDPVIPQEPIWSGAISLTLVHWRNTGTIWGMGKDFTVGLIVLRCIALVALVWFARRTAPTNRWVLLALGLVMAGAIGNLYDNFTQVDGGVRDFIYFAGSWPWEWTFPAFNVADSCITVGAITLLLTMFRPERGSVGDRERVS